ncbi:MAG: anaerobic ribonucleoside-triphosphate reductase activating protein [archaeon]
MKVKIGKIDLFSSMAYPEKPSTVIYFQGCNFKCPWCWSYEYIDPLVGEEKEVSQVIQEVKEDPTETEAVVIDGGEPTQQPKALEEMCKELKKEGYKVQINTNGTNPEIIENMGIRGRIDRLALDLKAPLEFQRMYSKTTGKKVNKKQTKGIKQILRVSNLCKYELEPRTTIIPNLTDSKHWISKIAKTVGTYTDNYVLQGFTPEKGTLNPEYEEEKRINQEELIKLALEARKYVKHVKIRTQETGTETIS